MVALVYVLFHPALVQPTLPQFVPLGVLCNLIRAIDTFNVLVSPEDTVTLDSIVSPPVHQRTLSSSLDLQCFRSLLHASSQANKAHLLSSSAPRASSWLTVVPTVELGVHLDPSELGVHLDPSELGVHLDPSEFCVAIGWWVGVDTSGGLPCPLCNDIALNPLSHHTAT